MGSVIQVPSWPCLFSEQAKITSLNAVSIVQMVSFFVNQFFLNDEKHEVLQVSVLTWDQGTIKRIGCPLLKPGKRCRSGARLLNVLGLMCRPQPTAH